MKVLITGGAGFIGTHLASEYLSGGSEVTILDSFEAYYSPDVKRSNARASEELGARLLDADLIDTDLPALLQNADAVVHLAGQPGVRPSWGEGFRDYERNNIRATQHLLEACTAVKFRGNVVIASSSSVYGQRDGSSAFKETDVCVPHSPYGVSKLATEGLAIAYSRNFDLNTVLLRYFTVYGPRQRPDMAFSKFIAAASTGAPIGIYGDGEQQREFTYVGDVARATRLASEAELEPGIRLNIGGGTVVTVNEAIGVLSDALGRKVEVEHLPEQAGDVRLTHADTTYIGEQLGWQPATSLRDGLEAQVRHTL